MTKLLKSKKAQVALVVSSVLLITAVAVFAMYQFVYSVENKFPAETLKIEMEESFSPPPSWLGEVVAKEVRYTNTGSIPALLRVLYSENFVSKDNGEFLSTKNPVSGLDIVKKNWNAQNGLNTLNWTYKDGWYYYNRLLKPGETIVTLESVEIPNFSLLPESYKNADYQLSFSYEYIEVQGKTAQTLWGIDQTKFGILSDGTIKWGF